MDDPLLEVISADLRTRHGCHTVILYGSRARGDATSTSDYDVLGVKESGDAVRDARLWNGVYLDIFIYPEARIREPDASLVHIKDGIVLFEKESLGSRFLERLRAIDAAGPKPLPLDEIQALKVWARKMVDRSRAGDIEGNFRRVWLLTALLEDYFLIRGTWYRGPKESLRWLERNDPAVGSAYRAALEPGAELSTLEDLVTLVIDDAGEDLVSRAPVRAGTD
jgi:predicted nucleotidyltransferase